MQYKNVTGLHYSAPKNIKPKDFARDRWLTLAYGLGIKGYNRLYDIQKGCCAICGTKKPRGTVRGLMVDHCHKTGKVRALLCDPCNRYLGRYERYREQVDAYLKRFST